MKCKVCLLTDDICKIMDDGRCEYCHLHDKLTKDYPKEGLEKVLRAIRNKGRGKDYDCLIGVSGGFDSAMLLHYAVRKWGLRPMVIHFNNGYNTPEAWHNMAAMSDVTATKLNTFGLGNRERKDYHRLNHAFLKAGVPDADIPNDMIMTALMYQTANKHGIKYILNGHNFRGEGSTPIKWTYMDNKYLQGVWKKFYNHRLSLPSFTFLDQIWYGVKGIQQVRPFYYLNEDPAGYKEFLINEYGLQDYGSKHAENVYTHFIGAYLLPRKFKIDKRIVYLSALVRSGYKSIKKAYLELSTDSSFPDDKLKRIDEEFCLEAVMAYPVKDRLIYGKYNFKRYRFIIYLLTKLKVVPYTFYKKYCLN